MFSRTWLGAVSILLGYCFYLVCAAPNSAKLAEKTMKRNEGVSSFQDDSPRTIDEVIKMASAGNDLPRYPSNRRMGSGMILDGLDMVLSEEQYSRLYGHSSAINDHQQPSSSTTTTTTTSTASSPPPPPRPPAPPNSASTAPRQ